MNQPPSSAPPVQVIAAVTPDHLRAVRGLLREYQAGLGVSLDFQDFESELAGLPGRYAAPEGRLFLALAGDEPAGCIGLRYLDAGIGEVKRLFVRERHRGAGLGRQLAELAVAQGRALGWERLVLDALPTLSAAQALYLDLGFQDIPAYTWNPIPGTRFLGLELAAPASPR
jgi:GNAT superfamily N-acetyltransferase